MVSWCVIRGRRSVCAVKCGMCKEVAVEEEIVPLLKAVVPRRPACGERDRIPFPSLRLFSATTLMDFSYTFHNFTVLSTNEEK